MAFLLSIAGSRNNQGKCKPISFQRRIITYAVEPAAEPLEQVYHMIFIVQLTVVGIDGSSTKNCGFYW